MNFKEIFKDVKENPREALIDIIGEILIVGGLMALAVFLPLLK